MTFWPTMMIGSSTSCRNVCAIQAMMISESPDVNADGALTAGPARAFALDRQVAGIGTLAAGAPGDVVLLDPEAQWVVEPERFASKGKNTPLAGVTLTGRVVATVVAGQLVHDETGVPA